MGKSLTGIGSTAREKLFATIMDKMVPGHTGLTKQFYRGVTPLGHQNIKEVSIQHWTGAGLIMCGVSQCGGEDVCGA